MNTRPCAFVLVVLLTACGDDQPPPPAPVLPDESTIVRPAPVISAPLPVLLPDPDPVMPEIEPEAEAEPQAEPMPHLPSAPVDLSLPPELLKGLHAVEPIGDEQAQSLLPPLFVEKPEAQPNLQFNGRLLLNNEIKEDYRKSLDGAELQFEYKR